MVGAAFSGWFKLVDGAGSSMVQVLLSLQWLVLVYQPSVVGAQAAEPSSSVSGAVASLQWLLLRLLQWLVLGIQPSVVEPSVVESSVVEPSVAGAWKPTFSGRCC